MRDAMMMVVATTLLWMCSEVMAGGPLATGTSVGSGSLATNTSVGSGSLATGTPVGSDQLTTAASVGSSPPQAAAPVSPGLLPAGTELGEEIFDRPREVFRSESRGGRRSQLVMLGEVAFSSPAILGPRARQAGISCNTCHINGTTNSRLFIPGLSTRPGTFDTTGSLFNPHADDGVLDPLTTPSLRGAHLLAPYGHDGRTLSLRDFVRNVITNEFAGPEPSQRILDAIVLYIEDIDFLPNRRLTLEGRLAPPMSDEERRGEGLFRKPFAHNPALSCAGCHPPHGLFVDHQQHDVGSGGVFKTPTLLNANFNAPYFHDGRYTDYAQVVAYFDRMFYLGLSTQDRQDLVAYLRAVGDGEQATEPDAADIRLREISDFAGVLDTALAERDGAVATLTADTIDREIRELTEFFPEPRSTVVTGGAQARAQARLLLKNLVLAFRQISTASEGAHFDEATRVLADARKRIAGADPTLQAAVPWSLFNGEIHAAHYAALKQLYRAAIDPLNARARRLDLD
jgi:cytochrome c peroxidase